MAHIVPSISFVKHLKSQLQAGKSLSFALEAFLERNNNSFGRDLQKWWLLKKHGQHFQVENRSPFQQSLFKIMDEGLKGAPVYEFLENLELEMEEEFERQWKLYLEKLPMILSIPLLFLFFPAYVVLLFGPLLNQFLQGVSL